ncbi:U3 small nucleolar RNA-associated protein 4 homolog [Vanessa atalanta]|uniref:U3 small nucleolar RNA-associated protein 4 homolog n=1 Tax=Vanessa atalanta TaxID=42275 RepID=UPI001FCCD6D8|nr:U3 small nucleolar RNA-associated protein 4 homolog [Vanessa atalanta]
MACKLHRVRFYNPKPEQINCVSFNTKSKLLALARQDASIEIWDLNFAPFLLKFKPGEANTSVEALGWVNHRLLSTGLGGALLEWDMETLSIKFTMILTGYAAWCLDVNSSNTLVAVGTEQGYINLYSVENDEIVYKKIFDKQEGRILCCKFNNTGSVLVTGSIDTIRVWNVETGHATCRMSVSRRAKETIVWCLAVLSDNTVISGDSHGRLTFWDGNLGDQIESYKCHKSNILSIAVSDDENSLYCSGVDPVIMNFVKVNCSSGKQSSAQWVKNVQRNIHEHDVRALVIHGDKLISVGADGYLTLSSYPPKWVMRIPPMIPAPRSAVCPQKKLLLLRYSNYLEVWKLGSYAVNESGNVTVTNVNLNQSLKQKDSNNELEKDSEIDALSITDNKSEKQHQAKSLKLTEAPIKLVSIQTKGKKQIKCCDLSPSGELIVYSTDSNMTLLKLECDDDQTNISLAKVLVSGLECCDRVAFTEDSRTMVAYKDGELKVLQVDPEAGATIVQNIACEKYLRSKCILHLQISKDTPSKTIYLVAADTQSDIAVWIKKDNKFRFYVSLPKYRCVPSALTFDNEEEKLIVAYVDQELIEYDLVKARASKSAVSESAAWRARSAAAAALCVPPARPAHPALLARDDSSLWLLRSDAPQADAEGPTPKKKNKKKNAVNPNSQIRIIPMKYLADFHWLGDDEAVTLEILPENIISQLPPVIATKRHNV